MNENLEENEQIFGSYDLRNIDNINIRDSQIGPFQDYSNLIDGPL